MIAYNKEWLENLRVLEQAEAYCDKGFINKDEFELTKRQYPIGFYMPNPVVRIGLFLLTLFIVTVGDGLLTLIAAASNVIESPGWAFFLGIISYIALEGIVRTKHNFRSGVDDALVLVVTCQFAAGFGTMLVRSESIDSNTQRLLFAIFLFLFTLILTVRFVDRLSAALSISSLFAAFFFAWNGMTAAGLATAPFLMMIVSALTYFIALRISKKQGLANYKDCFKIIEMLSLVVIYASGNYYIVQTLGNALGPDNTVNKPLPMGGFFWSYTLLMPLVYVFYGLKRKDSILLRLGLALMVAAIATFRYYYHLLPTDIMLTIAGALTILIAWLTIRYLATPKHGFTYTDPGEKVLLDYLRIESLITAEIVSDRPSAPSHDDSRFGGGDFGGGGASESF